MFNNPRIHLFNKLLCLFLTLLVIVFNTSSVSLLLMFIIYFMFIKNDDKVYSMIISLFFVGAFALLYIYDVTFWIKVILIIAYTYYFLYLDVNKIKFRKKVVKEVKKEEITKEEVKEKVEEKVNEELKNGDNLTEEEKEEIKNNLESKVETEYKEIKGNYFERYYTIQRKLSRRKYRFDSENILYLFIHMLALIICVVVEKL